MDYAAGELDDRYYFRKSGQDGLWLLVAYLCRSTEAIEKAYSLIVLSDRNIAENAHGDQRVDCLWRVHHHLDAPINGLRIGLIIETGEAREVHHHCLLSAMVLMRSIPTWHLSQSGKRSGRLADDLNCLPDR